MTDEFLTFLREAQDTQFRSARRHRMTFAEWSHEQDLRKVRGTPISPGVNPGVGMMGQVTFGGTSSVAPTGPSWRPSGNPAVGLKQMPQMFGVPGGAVIDQNPSKYSQEDRPQPAPWINDVDMSSIWYSPMEPVWPFGPPYYNRPREWNYPVGYNLNYVPSRMAMYGLLRGMRQSWGVLSTVIETRKDQLLRLPWTIQRRDKPRATNVAVDKMRKFFRRPDGKASYSQWSRRVLDDLFTIDAPSLFIDRDGLGKPKHVEALDGATIFPLIDDMGRRPDTEYDVDEDGITYLRRQPAFQQIIYGLPMINLSEDQLIYAMMRPRPELPMFGYSPVEQIIVEATEAIRKTFYQLEFWRSGSMPELVVTVPDAWTPRQIAMFQAHFDALLSGNLALKSKVRFLPGGMKPFDIKNASGESLWSQRDETLIRLCCYAFSVSPAPFVRMLNRSTAQNAQQTAQEEGLYPLMSWWKDDIMDRIIQEEFGYDDVEFVFLPRPEVDLLKQAQIHQIQLNEAIRTRNEIREELGQEPMEDGDIPTVQTGAGVMPLEMAVTGQHFAAGAGGMGQGSSQINDPKKPTGTPAKQNQPANQPQRGAARPHSEPSGRPSTVHKTTKLLAKAIGTLIDQAADGATEDLDTLSPSRIAAGNYPKGHLSIQGLNISIENNTGSKRGERKQDGEKEFVRMPRPYGYIRGTVGADRSQFDVYLGKHPESKTVWIIDQDKVTHKKGKNKGFDEHKGMLFYRKLKIALRDYLDTHFDGRGHERARAVVEMSMDEFKRFLCEGDLRKPVSEQHFGEIVLSQNEIEDFAKTDTISSATGLSWYDQNSTAVLRKPRKRKKRIASGPRWLELAATTSGK